MKIAADIKRQISNRISEMDVQYETWRKHWYEIQQYMLPRYGRNLDGKGTVYGVNDGKKKHSKVFDSTPEMAINILAAGMQGGLTSPARPWFRLTVSDPDLRDYHPVKTWLSDVEERMRAVFSKSNAYNVLHSTYKELGGFCTAAFMCLEDYETVIRLMPFTIGEYRLIPGANGEISGFYREFAMTVGMIVEKYGLENCSTELKSLYDQGSLEVYRTVCSLLEPADGRYDLQDAMGRPWRVLYWEYGFPEDLLLAVKGFDEKAFMALRWDVTGSDAYGHGPGMIALADAKMLMRLQEKSLVAIDKAIDPPLIAGGTMKNAEIDTTANGVTIDSSTDPRTGLRALYEVRPDLAAVEMKIERVQAAIRSNFFNDLFLMLASSTSNNMTATEVAERHEEKILMLGPVLERLHSELLNPLIDRVFAIMLRGGLLPEIPKELNGVDLKIEYISILAQAQRMVGVTSIQQYAGFIGGLAAVNPQILDKLDFDEAADQYAEAAGVNPRIVTPDDKVALIRAARAEQMQRQQQMAEANAMAQGAKTLSETSMKGNNALNALLGR